MSHKSAKKGKKHGGGHEEEHENHERWLVSYADMLTLLFVLFVVLFSMSTVDQKKFAQLANSLAQGFGVSSAALNGQASAIPGTQAHPQVIPPIRQGADSDLSTPIAENLAKDAKTQKAVKAAMAAASRSKALTDAQAAAKEVDNLKEVERKIKQALRKDKLDDQVKFTIDERGLVVSVISSDVVFAGDRADLQPGGETILRAVAPQLVKLPNKIEVDGHTNQLKVPTINYPSAWELSTARASIVVRALHALGLPEDRMLAAGFAGTKPLIDPKDPRAVTQNRRVDVIVLSNLPAAQKELLPSAAGEESKPH
ncbi:flagellar basal body stator protein MotB [Pilimelia anulata]|uniref:Flagellar basal body stator protein MotB n=1 Tax=Pilimelia anulata TaxID=53371 RepID=A0A8J3B516_9ACTN|nr:flagellar motor protein MotB [Pilimelia anulata]GGJ82369.1 flagellar basal body stator protein MotB [Pilimelia anulata]